MGLLQPKKIDATSGFIHDESNNAKRCPSCGRFMRYYDTEDDVDIHRCGYDGIKIRVKRRLRLETKI